MVALTPTNLLKKKMRHQHNDKMAHILFNIGKVNYYVSVPRPITNPLYAQYIKQI